MPDFTSLPVQVPESITDEFSTTFNVLTEVKELLDHAATQTQSLEVMQVLETIAKTAMINIDKPEESQEQLEPRDEQADQI